MMLSNAWNWAKKHRRKIIVGAVVVGGAIYIGRKLYRRARASLDDLLNSDHLKNDLLRQISLGRSAEWKMTLHYQRNQKVSDMTVKKNLENLRTKLFELFEINDLTQTLRDNSHQLSPDQKSAYFNQIKIQCLSRAVSSLYALHLLLLLHRLEINIIGKQMFGDDRRAGTEQEKAHDENYAFLSSTRYIQEAEGLRVIVKGVTRAVEACAGELQPQHELSLEELLTLLKDIASKADVELINDGLAVNTALPDNVQDLCDNERLSPDGCRLVAQFLSETRDFLESPQFVSVFRLVIDRALKKTVERLSDKFQPGQRFPLARTFGRFCQLSEEVLSSTFSNAYIEDFANTPAVNELSEMVYFPPDYEQGKISKTPSIGALMERLQFSP
ncbi:unnamed protein product [Vitrella brassicaformis CCMP3155]|uniref:Peroxisomal assembly protein PEX3 n=3 Tax=Vitrella brassicaformis TaxID=1169539 RepID=A0A0G4H8I1_VITBC|nr:unnamed protein product [Vitrella brassicaformis CCMP3155]|eukprot:CEM40076.1 unnamed protein product [Vitrella brassicaformis CCMP3155]